MRVPFIAPHSGRCGLILGLPPLPPWPGRAVEIAVSAGGSRMANPDAGPCDGALLLAWAVILSGAAV